MATFIGLHDMGNGVTEEMIQKSWDAYKSACEGLGCSAHTAYTNADQGKAFCITEADSADAVQKAHDNANVTIKDIIQVKQLQ